MLAKQETFGIFNSAFIELVNKLEQVLTDVFWSCRKKGFRVKLLNSGLTGFTKNLNNFCEILSVDVEVECMKIRRTYKSAQTIFIPLLRMFPVEKSTLLIPQFL